MSIKSTKTVKREWAISRICEINELINRRDYQELERVTNDPDIDMRKCVNYKLPSEEVNNLHNWTNTMLADQMDNPFFRESIFDNYFVEYNDD